MSHDFDSRSLGLFQKILLATDGTVTDLIALYTGESIRVKKLSQDIERRIAPAELRCAEPSELLHRRILLSGATENFLYADSLFVFDRFSTSIRHQLLNTDCPIGLLWKEEKLETYREVIDQRMEPCAEIAEHFSLESDALFVSRTYLIHHRGQPLGSITEKWPATAFRDSD
jgi:chorismate-pyruvate lyase